MRERFKISGTEYTFDEYKVLALKERAEMRERAIETLVHLNRNGIWDQRSNSFRAPYEVSDVMMDWERTVETPSEQLGRLLQTMDWTYQFSDDHRYWSAGHAQMEKINALTMRLGAEARAIWEQYAPEYAAKREWK